MLRLEPDGKRRTASHEAAHIVASAAIGLSPIIFATIDPTKSNRAGYVQSMSGNYDCKRLFEFSAFALHDLRRPPLPQIDGKRLSAHTAVLLYGRAVMLLAGGEAVRLLFGPDHDFGDKNDLTAAAFCADRVTSSPRFFLDCARADAARIVAMRRTQVEMIAAALLEYRSLYSTQIKALLSGVPDALRRTQMAASYASAELFSRNFGNLRCLSLVLHDSVQCPLQGVKRKTYARIEFFRF